jgi:hypothetical protein
MSWWELTRKWRTPPPVSHLKHWFVDVAVSIALVGCLAGLSWAFTGFPGGQAVSPAIVQRAWGAALDKASATSVERAEIPRPPVVLFPNVRMRPTPQEDCPTLKPGEACLMRMCGETELFLTLGPDGRMQWTTNSTLFLLPSESARVEPTLRHEYLHTIWTWRVEHDPSFFAAHRDSEAWVAGLEPVACPAP